MNNHTAALLAQHKSCKVSHIAVFLKKSDSNSVLAPAVRSDWYSMLSGSYIKLSCTAALSIDEIIYKHQEKNN